jgi:hypothetical protein
MQTMHGVRRNQHNRPHHRITRHEHATAEAGVENAHQQGPNRTLLSLSIQMQRATQALSSTYRKLPDDNTPLQGCCMPLSTQQILKTKCDTADTASWRQKAWREQQGHAQRAPLDRMLLMRCCH